MMDSLHKFETTVADWYKNVPHIPKGGQKWIADNVWWIVLVAVIFGAFAIVSLFTLIAGLSVVTTTYGIYGSAYNTIAPTVYTGLGLVTAWLTLAALAASTVVMACAISPLKHQTKKGWDLLFLSDILYFALVILAAVASFNFFGIVGPLISTAISFYFLFEIRSYFHGAKLKVTGAHKK
jgi:hypothetical protein